MTSSIVTVTLSPTIDKSTTIEALVPDKKLKCSSPKLDPGGGGINVARAVKKLGGDAIAIFPSGGYTGKYLNHLVRKEKIQCVIIECAEETRENIIVLDESVKKQYRFGFPGTELSESEWKKCLQAVRDIEGIKYLVVSGSLPPGVPETIYDDFSKIASEKNAKLVVDAPGEYLNQIVKSGVYLIKPNIGELAKMIGKENIDVNELPAIAQKIINDSKCEIILVSMGKEGAMLITKDEHYKVKAPEVTIQSTVGAGDSMVAGVVHSLDNGSDYLQVLQYGVACGTAATMQPGTELCDKKNTDSLFAKIADTLPADVKD